MNVETDTKGESITITITVDDERLYREVPLAIIQRSAQIRGNPSSTDSEKAVVEELDEIGAELLEVLPGDVVNRESNTIKFWVSNEAVFEEVIHGLGIRSVQINEQDRDIDNLDIKLHSLQSQLRSEHLKL